MVSDMIAVSESVVEDQFIDFGISNIVFWRSKYLEGVSIRDIQPVSI